MTLKTNKTKPKNKPLGFTIVELLVVIVIIGILAAITIVSYIGISKNANESTLQSDLATAKKQFALYYTEHGVYPTGLDGNKCPTGTTDPSPDTNYCLKPSTGDDITISDADGSKYKLTATKGTLSFSITEDGTPSVEVLLPESDWITIGTQRWARKNLNVGVRINGALNQTNNGGTNVVEKYCYGDDEANCTLNDNGGLYQWNEAMNYSTSEGVQGICPAGSHIPTDNDWKIFEMQLGMTQAQADVYNSNRGTDQAFQLRPGGGSGFNMPYSGLRDYYSGLFYDMPANAYLWTSTLAGGNAWYRHINNVQGDVFRYVLPQSEGLPIRCLGD